MIKVEFENHKTTISEEEFNKEEFDIDFNGQMMIRFERKEGKIIATNGMNGYGENGKELIILE